MDYVSRASRFCELVRQTGVAQPVNSWSCVVFVLVGIWIAWRVKRDGLTSSFARSWGYFYAVVVALIGLGSFWNHAALNRAGGTADVESMFLLASFLVLYAISRLIKVKQPIFITILVLANIPLTYIASLPGVITDYVFATLIFAVIAFELIIYLTHRYRSSWSYFGWAFAALVSGYIIWQLDVRGIWCNPTSLWQGHAVWHILTALSAGLFYKYLSTTESRV